MPSTNILEKGNEFASVFLRDKNLTEVRSQAYDVSETLCAVRSGVSQRGIDQVKVIL